MLIYRTLVIQIFVTQGQNKDYQLFYYANEKILVSSL